MGFSITRLSQTFVRPSEPTPSDALELSIIDRVPGLRHAVRSLHVFNHGDEPTKLIRDALSKALVAYYPFAGRYSNDDEGGAIIDCNSEGVCFVEATADCTLDDVNFFEHYPQLISPDELLPRPPPDVDILDLPVLVQVTEFKCGGFVVGLISTHTIADGLGFAQFIRAIGDLARGLPLPVVTPITSRAMIPNPPKFPPGPPPVFPSYKLASSDYHLSPDYIAKIKSAHFDLTARHCSTFDISIATIWQARTRAMKLEAGAPVSLCFFANTRHLLPPPQDGGGFYGNCFYPVHVRVAMEEVAGAETVDVVRLIRDGKARLPEEFARWAREGGGGGGFEKDPYQLEIQYDSLFVSDWSQLGFLDVDYGWGKPAHVVPFAYVDFMAVAILQRPKVPRKGAWLTTQCVLEEHLPALEECMSQFKF